MFVAGRVLHLENGAEPPVLKINFEKARPSWPCPKLISSLTGPCFHGKKRIATTFNRRVSSVEEGTVRGGKKVHLQRINMVFSIARFNTWALQ